MKNETDLLQKEYDTVINQTDPWYFFKNLADYVKFVNETSPFREIVEPLKNQKEELLNELDKYEEKAVEELVSAKKKLEKLVSKVDGLKEKLKRESFFSDGFSSIDQYLGGRLHTSGNKSDVINRYLHDVAWDISSNGHSKLLDKWTVEKRPNQRIVYFSQALEKRHELTEELNTQRQLNLWGYWDFLSISADKSIFVWSDWTAKYPAVDQAYLSEHVSIKHELQENKPIENTFPRIERQKRDFVRESRVPTHKHYLERIHLYLLKEYNNRDKQNKTSTDNKGIKINKITFVKKNTFRENSYSFYINNDLKSLKQLRRDSHRIGRFIEFLEGKDIEYDKDTFDYINSNKECVLYCSGKYTLTKILEKDGKTYRVNPEIRARVITEIAYKKELNRSA